MQNRPTTSEEQSLQKQADDILKQLNQIIEKNNYKDHLLMGAMSTQDLSVLLTLILYTIRTNQKEKLQLFARLYKEEHYQLEINQRAINLLKIIWGKDELQKKKDLLVIKDIFDNLFHFNIKQTFDQFKTRINSKEKEITSSQSLPQMSKAPVLPVNKSHKSLPQPLPQSSYSNLTRWKLVGLTKDDPSGSLPKPPKPR